MDFAEFKLKVRTGDRVSISQGTCAPWTGIVGKIDFDGSIVVAWDIEYTTGGRSKSIVFVGEADSLLDYDFVILKMRYPQDISAEGWLDFILGELPSDPGYKGTFKSAAALRVWLNYHAATINEEFRQGQAKELRRMERRNLKLQQRLTRMNKNETRKRW
jgi:hypothetical protein